MSDLKNNPAWQALMQMPVLDTRTAEEKADWQAGLDDVQAGRFKKPTRRPVDAE